MAGRRIFVAGEILTAANVQSFLQDQAVMVFDDDTARTTAIPSPVEGMVTYLKDTNLVEAYTGAAFTSVSGILQVVSTTKTDTFTTSAGSFVDVTGMAATITPNAASNKVLILVQAATAGDRGQWRLTGGNSGNYIGDTASSRTRAIFGFERNVGGENAIVLASSSIIFLDSPNTTSAVTYQLQTKSNITSHLNRTGEDGDSADRTRGASSITLLEVAG